AERIYGGEMYDPLPAPEHARRLHLVANVNSRSKQRASTAGLEVPFDVGLVDRPPSSPLNHGQHL
ncbi:hypothetical protein B6U99_07205, partial [Candidatus Geothermarchaeota archaeon ex4572_27]